MEPSLEQRFWAKVKKGPGCWEWTAMTNPKGYGIIGINHVPNLAHRVSYQLEVGPIPTGKCVLHRCDNPACVRPKHLFLGTKGDNNRDMHAKGRAFTKLTAAQVREMRAKFKLGQCPAAGRAYGVTHRMAHLIITRQSWRHV